jgi:Chalcone isomerase-like
LVHANNRVIFDRGMICWSSSKFLVLQTILLLLVAMDRGCAEPRPQQQHHSHVLEGVHLPLEKTLTSAVTLRDESGENGNAETVESSSLNTSPHRLLFNGAGVRSIRMLGWDFKVYVAGFYTSVPLETVESVYQALDRNNMHTPMQLDFTFLRAVNQGRVTDAWRQQTEHSVEHTYPGYEKDRASFIDCFGPIEHGGTESVQLLSNGKTVVIDQNVRKCVIDGKDFQKAFLSMWFGSKAVSPDLKEGLLGNVNRFGLQPRKSSSSVEINMNGEYAYADADDKSRDV